MDLGYKHLTSRFKLPAGATFSQLRLRKSIAGYVSWMSIVCPENVDSAVDVCVTSDIPLASRCLKKGARVVSSTGHQWTEANIGNAFAGREIARHLRELGAATRGPAPLTKRDRSRFLSALDTALQAALREEARS